jgi:hypothetical protein
MSLVHERPLLMTIDPETGFPIRCDVLKAAAETCFDDAYNRIGTTGDPGYDRDRARQALAPCYRQARHVVRVCGLGVRIGPRRR